MKIENLTNNESLESFKIWWASRISKRTNSNGNTPHLPNFFEVWDARQPEIDKLRKENRDLKDLIEKLKQK